MEYPTPLLMSFGGVHAARHARPERRAIGGGTLKFWLVLVKILGENSVLSIHERRWFYLMLPITISLVPIKIGEQRF